MALSQAEVIARAERFAALHRPGQPLVLPNPWDVGTARVLASLGFAALATTSAGFAFSLGRKDGAISRDEALAHAADIVAATDLPVAADLENGFGPRPEDAAETIRRAGAIGLAGASIEDSSGDTGAPIYDRILARERIVAAVEAARGLGRPFVLTARAENFLHGRPDLDDTLARLADFEAAGADALYAPGLGKIEDIKRVCSAVKLPVNVLGGGAHSVADLAAAGAARVSLGSALALAAWGGFMRAARELKASGSFGFKAEAAGFGEITAFMAGRGDPVS
jgi:2-methylisocitrate lyase-like PEP mutase family enzyme